MSSSVRIADLLGRRKAMSVECLVYTIGVVIQITSYRFWQQFAVGRLVSGLGVGALSATVPMVNAMLYSINFDYVLICSVSS